MVTVMLALAMVVASGLTGTHHIDSNGNNPMIGGHDGHDGCLQSRSWIGSVGIKGVAGSGRKALGRLEMVMETMMLGKGDNMRC